MVFISLKLECIATLSIVIRIMYSLILPLYEGIIYYINLIYMENIILDVHGYYLLNEVAPS